MFVLKLDGDGQVVWSRSFGSFDSDFGNGVAATFDGGAFVTGMFRGTVVFDGLVLVSAGGPDAFVLSLNPDGTRRWAGRFGGPFGDYGMSIAAAPDAGCYVTGIFQGSVNFGTGILTSAGYDDAFVMKLDPTGITRWSRRYGGTLTDRGMSVSATPEDEAVVTGYFAQTIDFGGGPFTTAGANDIFVVKLNRNGTHVWSQRFGSASDDYGNGAAGIGRGGALVTGSFSDSANFGGGVEHSAGAWDAFAVRLGPQGIPAAGTGLRLVLGSALAAVAALVLRRRSA